MYDFCLNVLTIIIRWFSCINSYDVWLFVIVTDDNATYKVQEYFSYNQNSFYDLECDLEKHRLEQPSPTKD